MKTRDLVSNETYEKWSKLKYNTIIESNNDEEQVAAIDGEIEKDLVLIGSTAIEDKLQENVADSIQFMKQAGIKVWVITGDKVETSINIGVSAGLIDQGMN